MVKAANHLAPCTVFGLPCSVTTVPIPCHPSDLSHVVSYCAQAAAAQATVENLEGAATKICTLHGIGLLGLEALYHSEIKCEAWFPIAKILRMQIRKKESSRRASASMDG